MQQAQIHELYDDEFYKGQASSSYASAKTMLPQVQELFGEIKSVIDVGCGVGTWLRAWSEINPSIKIFGIDGNAADEKLYEIPLESYKEVNLTHDADSIIKEIMTKYTDANNIGGGGAKCC